MKLFIYCASLVFIVICTSLPKLYAQNSLLTKQEVKQDLAVLGSVLQNQSSYQSLNGYDYKKDIQIFLDSIKSNVISTTDFGLFLSKTIGKLGDRHASIKGYNLPESLYFPLSFAPINNHVYVLKYNESNSKYDLWNSEYPILNAIEGIPITDILNQISLADYSAPDQSKFMRAVRELRDIETVFRILDKDLPNPILITLQNESGKTKDFSIPLVDKKQKAKLWDERFKYPYFFFEYYGDQLSDINVINSFFSIKDGIAQIHIPSMVEKNEVPLFFERLESFMVEEKNTKALIIDVRDNGGGTRDLIQELAGYIVHPDSIYVVNATRQRCKLPISDDVESSLHTRYLFSKGQLNINEQKAVDRFTKSFDPMYTLDNTNFSSYYYYILNGNKLGRNKSYYDKPIYILANERTFSAASVLVSVFKDLPNVTIAGVRTDGSSGNSDRFTLPNSGFRGKISTMVSFQKNGQILDGFGTEPDIQLKRNLEQILFNDDYQMLQLIKHINDKN